MSIVEKYISPFVESQYPAFFKEQGPLFILFTEEYFKWLESNDPNWSSYEGSIEAGNPNYHIRRLFEYRDIDSTVEAFLTYFKEKYLKNVQVQTNISKRRLIKAAQDIFSAKGSERSLDLFFQMVFGKRIEVYIPGNDILRVSDGIWTIPKYLELTKSVNNINLPGKEIEGTISGARAFVEYIVSRNITGRLIDIAYLSNVRGQFLTSEAIVLPGGIIANAPLIVGSLSDVDITTGGQNFEIGEIVKLESANGVEGLARVSEVEEATGLVRFTVLDGGWGYSVNALALISTKVLGISNTTGNGFIRFETLTQNNYSFTLNNVTGDFSVGGTILNGNTSTPSVSILVNNSQNTATVSNTANIVTNQISGNVFSNSVFYEKNKAIIYTYTDDRFSVGEQVVQQDGGTNNVLGIVSQASNSIVLEVNATSVGANGLHVGVYLEQQTTGASGYIDAITRENNYTFTNVSIMAVRNSNGTFNNTNNINVYSDSTKVTQLGEIDITQVFSAYKYVLVDTNLTTDTRWSFGNTVLKVGDASINTTIIVASDVGGIVNSYINVTPTANIMGANVSAIGLISVSNTFYATGKTIVYSPATNTYANTTTVYTGTGASFNIGVIENAETVLLSPDLLNANNDGPGSNSVKFMEMLITGANSTFGNLNSVYIELPGTGYDNTNVVTFSGGNTGGGSYTAGNASIVTDTSGNIVTVILSANVGSGIVTTPSVSIVNSTGGSTGVGTGASLIPASSLGFVKLPVGDITYRLIDLFRFNSKTIGSISTLSSINPGENYNIGPFVLAYEPEVAAYGKKDIIINTTLLTGPGFIAGETIEQTISTPAILVSSNNFSGNTSGQYDVFEIVYTTDGISNTGTGVIYSTTKDLSTNIYSTVITSNTGTWQNTISVSVLTVDNNTSFNSGSLITQGTANGILVTSNSSALVVKNVSGTFQSNATSVSSNTGGTATISSTANTKIYRLNGLTTGGITDILDTDAYTASTLARGVVKSVSNNTSILKRTSLFTEFNVGNIAVGKSSGTTANVVGVAVDSSSNTVGDNAVIAANVVTSSGSIRNVEIVSSGFGYVDDEGITIKSFDNSRQASGKAQVQTSGVGEGYYSTTRGFLDSNKYIQDGEYYQNFSYEIRVDLSFDEYAQVLTEVLHTAGKKFFGSYLIEEQVNTNIVVVDSITTS